jgi:hypothetical protein
MGKKVLLLFLAFAGVLGLVACGETGQELTSIDFEGIADVEIENGSTFNFFDGVTAKGNNDEDFTDSIVITSTSDAVNTETGALDTLQTGVHAVRYEVTYEGITARLFRYVTVKSPQVEEGEMLANGDMSLGVGGWNEAPAFFELDGGAATMTAENGQLKIDVTAGWNIFPRFGQMGIPFENGKTYEITFEAQSSVEKEIQIQVGKLFDGPPYYADHNSAFEVPFFKTITTDLETYSFKVTINNADDVSDSLLFSLGTIKEKTVNAVMYFDNITIEESTPDSDTTGPVISGIDDVTITSGTAFDPLAGVKALDVVDGDITSALSVVITDAQSNVVDPLSTNVDGVYTITYTSTDAANNQTVETRTLTVVSMTFTDTGKILNGDFAGADLTPWTSWGQDWGVPAAYTATLVDGAVEIDITNPGDGGQRWTIQYLQGNILLERGETYQLSFDAKASVARDIAAVLYNADTGINYVDTKEFMLTTEMENYAFVFTMVNDDILTQLQFLLGATPNYAAGVVTIDNVKLSTLDQDPLLKNADFSETGFTTFFLKPGNSMMVSNGEFVIDVQDASDQVWAVQFNQDVSGKLAAETTYVLTFDAYAEVARDINVAVFHATTYARHGELLNQMLTTTSATYTLEFTTLADNLDNVLLSFELGATTDFAAGEVYFDNISLVEKDDTTELIINGSASEVADWTVFNEGDGQATMTLEDGSIVYEVTGLGGLAYQPHLYQMIDSLEPGTYHLVFRVSADVARDLRINMVLPDNGYNSLFANGFVDFTTVENDSVLVSIEFTITDIVTNVKFELDFGTLGGDKTSIVGTFTIDEILLYEVVA